MQHLTSKLIAVAALLLASTLVAACSGGDNEKSEPNESAELRLSLRVDPISLDPGKAATANDLGVIRQLFRGLLWYDDDLKLIPMAAKQVPTEKNGGISEDGLVYKFTLRDELVWSDGKPLTAADFEYGFKRLLDPATAANRAAAYYDIKGAERYNTCKTCPPDELAKLRDEVGVKAVDDETIVFTLSRPRSTLPYLLAEPAAFPVRRDVIDSYGDKWTEPQNIVGNGPFVLKERLAKDRLVLTPNPHWWGARPMVQSVVFKVIADPVEALNAYLSGDLDIAEVPPAQKATVDNDPILAEQNVMLPLIQTTAYFFNNRRAPFDNAKVRQAFALAVDREAFVTEVLQGVGRPAYSWAPPDSPGHSKSLGREWKLDPEEARRTLAEAGYPDGASLPPITYAYPTSGLDKLYAEFLQAQIRRNLNVSIELVPTEPRAWREAFLRKEHMLVYATWAFSTDVGSSFLDIFGCQRYEGDACAEFPGNNIPQYANAEVDRLLQQALKEPDLKRRVGLYAKAEKIIVADSPVLFMTNVDRNLLVKPLVRDLVMTPLDSLFPGQYALERAYIAAE